MPEVPEVVFFAGPTLTGMAVEALRGFPLRVDLRAPVARGDVERLCREREPGVMVVVDGFFHNALSVGHAELRRAIQAGWVVWGLSSIGAIRACEMRNLGMRGFGEVFRQYVEDELQDDEVTLLHGDEPPYQAATEPLIHIRCAVRHFAEQGYITEAFAASAINELKRLWYGERTLARLYKSVRPGAEEVHREAIREALRDFDRFRVKTHDLTAFLQVPAETVMAAG